MPITTTGVGPPSLGFSPDSLPSFQFSILPALSRSQGKLWQDVLQTVPAVADGDPVRVAVCPYSGIGFTATSDAARPTLFDEGSGRWSLLFDGVDDYIRGILPAPVACSAATRYIRVFPVTGTGSGSAYGECRLGSSGTPIVGEIYLNGATVSARFRDDGNTLVATSVAPATSGAYVTYGYEWTGSLLTGYENGVAGVVALASGTATVDRMTATGNANSPGTTVNCRVAGVVFTSDIISSTQRTSLNAWLDTLA